MLPNALLCDPEPSTHLVNGIVYHFIHQVVKATLPSAANVHAWTLAHWLKALKHLQSVRL
jgi:hypothetical protein